MKRYIVKFKFPTGEYTDEFTVECDSLQLVDDRHLIFNGATVSFPSDFEIIELKVVKKI